MVLLERTFSPEGSFTCSLREFDSRGSEYVTCALPGYQGEK